ncbi:hypothetical protein [Elizabethkingia anophelis]|uniref:hypothetical protein n=1 Tax=Elizabethkingia anophelis TaxID=1117645 RepID=UPI002468F5F7|nr:hypothetical protein [Elizabethkingia anophelis]WGL69547.1 hypothetical protein QFB79_16870 [Elizabethkingia anophelis]
MYRYLIVVLFFYQTSIAFCQEITKIEFNHSNSIIINSKTNIVLIPIKSNKKNKVKVEVKTNDETYYYRLSRDKYKNICDAIAKIENDTIAINSRIIDGSSTSITISYKDNEEKSYYASGLEKSDENNQQRGKYWNAVNLIIKAARLRMSDLSDYY